MTAKKHLIIGAGAAALSAFEEIRRTTSEDEVKLVTMEDCPPYSPAALCHLLSGRIAESDLRLRDESYFRSLGGTLARGKEVVSVLPEKKEVMYRNGSSESYDTLLIASGSEPVKPAIRGLEEVGARDFRTLTDCRHLLQQLNSKKSVAILGAGLVGMHLATALLEKGHLVNIIEKEANILPLYFDEEAEVYIREIFTEHNARFFTGKEVTGVKRDSEKLTVTLSDGSSMDVNILLNATGVKSRVSFLERTGVGISNGILVDRRMRTGVDRIYAAGDVAEAPDFFTGKPKISAIIASAVTQGRVAGANMAGRDVEYEGVIPVTAFSFFGNTAFSAGLAMSRDSGGKVFKQNDDNKKRFKKLVFNGDRLAGGMFVNERIDPGVIHHLIKTRLDMSPYREALFEGTKPLSDPWLSPLKFRPHNLR